MWKDKDAHACPYLLLKKNNITICLTWKCDWRKWKMDRVMGWYQSGFSIHGTCMANHQRDDVGALSHHSHYPHRKDESEKGQENILVVCYTLVKYWPIGMCHSCCPLSHAIWSNWCIHSLLLTHRNKFNWKTNFVAEFLACSAFTDMLLWMATVMRLPNYAY